MSLIHVLRTVEALLKDPSVGLGAQVKIAAVNAGVTVPVRTDFRFVDWTLADNAKPGMQPSITIMPSSGRSTTLAVNTIRDSLWTLDISYECFDSEPATIKASIAVVSAALTVSIDHLVQYSQTTAPIPSAIQQVIDPLVFALGQYAGKSRSGIPTTSGFICSVTLQERSRDGS